MHEGIDRNEDARAPRETLPEAGVCLHQRSACPPQPCHPQKTDHHPGGEGPTLQRRSLAGRAARCAYRAACRSPASSSPPLQSRLLAPPLASSKYAKALRWASPLRTPTSSSKAPKAPSAAPAAASTKGRGSRTRATEETQAEVAVPVAGVVVDPASDATVDGVALPAPAAADAGNRPKAFANRVGYTSIPLPISFTIPLIKTPLINLT